MSDELEQSVPVNAGGRTPRGFLPGIRFEAVIDGAGGGGDAGAGAGAGEAALANGAGAAAAADAGTDGTGAAPAGAGVDFNDPAVLEQLASHPGFLEFVDTRSAELAGSIVDQRFSQLEQVLQQHLGPDTGAAGAPPAGADEIDLNPWQPEFGQNLQSLFDTRLNNLVERFEGAINRLAQPMMAREEQETIAEGNERLKDMLTDDISRNGEFPRLPDATESKAEQLVTPLARMLFPEIAKQFGSTRRASEIAMGRAAGIVRSIIAEAQAHASNAETNRLNALNGAGNEVGAAAVGVQTVGERQLRGWGDFSSDTGRHAAAIRGGQ